jgi:D-psicose/D-tagatose/L-ribulose 3-epimerase
MAVEYLNRFEIYFLTTAAQAARFVRAVDHPYCKMMYDSFHAHIEEKDQARAIASCAAETIHVHVSENDRGIPGTGQVHWDSFFRGLLQSGYDGYLTIEAFGRALPALAAATRVWRDLFPDPMGLCRDGLAFVKSRVR